MFRQTNAQVKTALRTFSETSEVKRTALYSFHKEQMQARMVPFAGYQMPVSYPLGTMKEHLHCRSSVGLFDVSHMGQVRIKGKDASSILERATVVDTRNLAPGQASLSLLMNLQGGIKDDCIITKVAEDDFYVVFNGACKVTDLAHLRQVQQDEFASKDVSIEYNEERSLIAVQGPSSPHLMESLFGLPSNSLAKMGFMECILDNDQFSFEGKRLIFSRCGYTGEDGFEVSVPNAVAESFMHKLLSIKGDDGAQIAQCVGLGARDSLRLEAGLCLYGNDLTEETSPIEGMLAWTISKRRKEEGGFLGYDVVKKHIDEGVQRKRCGFVVEGKMPVREGAELVTRDESRTVVGKVTSGSPAPSFEQPIGMAYC
jgi:aminomethyltransferase